MSTATWIKNELEQKGVHFDELQHSEAFTAQAVAQQEHVSGHRVAKVVAIMADGHPVELILPASRRVRLDAVKRIINADRVRLASEAEIDRYFTDCERGAIPALRHWPRIGLLMDGSLHVDGDIVFPGGTHRDAIRMRFDDWFYLVEPRVEDFTEPESERSYEMPERWHNDERDDTTW
jgi:Ala-tRNA(Pro) deacylase